MSVTASTVPLAFDTAEGIAKLLANYRGFYRLVLKNREDTGTMREEPLASFCVMGRYYLSGSGLTHRLSRSVFSDEFRALAPPVMTGADFFTKCRELDLMEVFAERRGEDARAVLRPPHVICADCGMGFHDTVADSDDYVHELIAIEKMQLDDLACKSLPELFDSLAYRTDAVYTLTSAICAPDGRTRAPERVQRIRPGDYCSATVTHFYHPPCHAMVKKRVLDLVQEDWRRKLIVFLADSGFGPDLHTEVLQTPLPERIAAQIRANPNIMGNENASIKDVIATLSENHFSVTTDIGALSVMPDDDGLTVDVTKTGLSLTEVRSGAVIDLAEVAGSAEAGLTPPFLRCDDTADLQALCIALLKRKMLQQRFQLEETLQELREWVPEVMP